MKNRILDRNNQPFATFSQASQMRDQLDEMVPETNFVVVEVEGGYAVESRQPKQGYHAEGKSEGGKSHIRLSADVAEFIQSAPITLRPALRVHWFNLLLGTAIILMSFQAVQFIRQFVPLSWYMKVLNILPQFPLIIFTIVFLTGFFQLLLVLLKVYSYSFVITQDGVASRFGIVSRDAHSIKYQDIRGVALEQSWFERLLGVGTIEFYTAGSDGADVIFRDIAHAELIRDYLDEYAAHCRR